MYRLKVKELRMKENLTQRQLSKLSKVSRNYISDLELGKHDSTVEVLIRLCIAFNVSPNELLDWENIKNNTTKRSIKRWKEKKHKKIINKRKFYSQSLK